MEFRFLVGPEVEEAEKQIPDDQKVNWPVDSIIGYCFEKGKIVGRIGLMAIKIIEGTWVAPDAPPTTAFRLMKQMEGVIQVLGNTHALALVHDETPKIGEYLRRVNFERFPVTLYCKELVDGRRDSTKTP